MKKKRSIRLINAGDILLTILCLIGMAVALYLFWDDLNVSLAKQDEAPIAVVYFKQNTVQRRMVDRNLWERVQTSALVYEGDRIRTSELSEAVTVFADGTEIEIHENTLIQIYTQKEKAAIDFISGAITASTSGVEDETTDGRLLVKTGDKVVELNSGTVTSIAAPVSSSGKDAADKASVAVTVTKGSASVRDAQKSDSYQETAAAKSVMNVAQNSLDNLGTTARQMLATARAAAGETVSEELVAPKQVVRSGEVSLVKTVVTDQADDETAEESVSVEKRKATLYLPVSSTTVRVEQGVMPIIQTKWESNTDLTFEFARNASFTKTLFTRTYPSYQTQSYISLEDYAEPGSLFWRAYFAGDPDSIFAMGVVLVQNAPDESEQEMIDRVLNDEQSVPLKDEPDTQEEAIKAEAIRKEEEERKAREEAARLDAQREAERIEAERKAAEEAEAARLAAEKAEEERLAAEKAAEEEALRKAEEERLAAEREEQARLEAEREAAEKALTERRLAAARAAEEKRLAAEKAAAEKAAAEKAAQERAAKAEAERIAREEAERKAQEEEARRLEAQKRLEEEQARVAAQKKAQEEAARLEAERLAEQKRLAEEKLAAEQAAQLAAQREAFAASSVTLREPAAGKVLDDAFFDTNRSLTFSWTPVANASSYEVIIKQKGLFSKTILDRTVSSTSFTLRTLSDLDEGEFEWTVIGKMSDGTQSKPASGSFTVHLEPLEDIELDTSGLFHR